MLPKTVHQLVQNVFAHFGESKRREAEQHPEACLVALLTAIQERLPETWATLATTVEMATYRDSVEEAQRQLERASLPSPAQ